MSYITRRLPSAQVSDPANIQAAAFGASPSASGAVNSAAINRAITYAKAHQNANVVIGAGTYEISDTLVYSGANKGITTIGVLEGSLSQGSVPGISVLKWTGGASPMIDASGTYHTFTGFSLQNSGTATHGIRCSVGGRQWMDRLLFTPASNAFSTASIELGSVSSGVNYDRVTRCEFEAGPAIKVLGNGSTLLVSEFMMDSSVGTGAFIDIQGTLDVLTIREGTVNYQTAMATFIDMSSIGSARVSVCRVENNEFDGNAIAVQMYIAKVNNCDAFIFEANQVSGFGNVANVESLITATDSRVTMRGNVGSSINQALVRTLDTSSYVFCYESSMNLTNTVGVVGSTSQSGTLIAATVAAVDSNDSDVIIKGNLASAMSDPIFVATLDRPAVLYTTDVGMVTFSANKGYMTKGQRFTVIYHNDTGGAVTLAFDAVRFTICSPAPTPPAAGERLVMNFYWDGTTAREIRGSAAA